MQNNCREQAHANVDRGVLHNSQGDTDARSTQERQAETRDVFGVDVHMIPEPRLLGQELDQVLLVQWHRSTLQHGALGGQRDDTEPDAEATEII